MRDGVETLEKRHAAWHRLLATFRAVHGGIEHDRLRLPAYGGSLFDPRAIRSSTRRRFRVDDRADARPCSTRSRCLSFRQGGVTEARRLSYLNLDVEQIGHVYEGLLDHGCARVTDVALGLDRRQGRGAGDRARATRARTAKGEDAFAEWIAEKGGPQASRVKKLLFEELEPDDDHRLLAACDNDQATYKRVRPFGGLLRKDLRALPAVFMPGRSTSRRRRCGATPGRRTRRRSWPTRSCSTRWSHWSTRPDQPKAQTRRLEAEVVGRSAST